jgi:hypothetical protein
MKRQPKNLFRMLVCLLFLLAAGCGSEQQAQSTNDPYETPRILGTKPTYINMSTVGIPSTAPAYANKSAITECIWAPQLDDGYDHQGLTYLDGTIYVAAYQTENSNIAACRVFAVSATDGSQTGYFDLPDTCSHAGGLTMMGKENGKDIIVLSDTYVLYKIDLAKALELKSATGDALLSVVYLSKTAEDGLLMKGSFVDFDGTNLWIGTSEPDNAANALAYQLDTDIFTKYKDQTVSRSTTNLVKASIPIPLIANGMTFDSPGNMWITSTNSKHGILYKLDPTKGCSPSSQTKCTIPGTTTLPPHYNIPIGSEDLSFDENGKLWTVSEAGCKHWQNWSYSYPFVYQIDTSKLVEP